MRPKIIGLTLLLLFLITPSSGLTRYQSVIDFVDSTRLSDSGFADLPSGDINLISTVEAMEIKSVLGDELNNSLDILRYFQRLQNSSGGFSPDEISEPDLQATFSAVRGFQYLELNQSQYVNWQIYPFINETVFSLLMNDSSGENRILPLNVVRMQTWNNYLMASSRLSVVPTIPVLNLIDAAKALQYANGSYLTIEHAIEAVNLLSMLGEEPNDPDLTSKFIRSYIVDNGAFSLDNVNPGLDITYRALIALSNIMSLWELENRIDVTRFVFTLQKARSGFTEVGELQPTIKTTRQAIVILFLLDELDELNAPDVLQEVGFIPFDVGAVIMAIALVTSRRRRR